MTLAANDIHLYLASPDDITDPGLLAQYEALLSDDEKSRLNNFHYEHHRHLYLITRALVRTTLSEYVDVKPASWDFGKNRYGKPFISQPSTKWVLKFNISHTKGLVICAITRDFEIGVDIEDRQRSTRSAFSSLFSYFSAEEIAELEALSSEQQKHRFFEHWTLKEAYIKARGAGFAIPLNQFGFHFEADRIAEFRTHPDLNDLAQNWQFWQIPYGDCYEIAIALGSNNSGMNLTMMRSVPLQKNEVVNPENISHFRSGN